MEHKKNKNKNKVIKLTLQILVFVLVASGVFYGTYYIFINKSKNSYEINIKDVVNKVNTLNDSVSSFYNGQALQEIENIRKELPNKIDTLSKIRKEAGDLVPTDKYLKDHENYLLAVDKNLLIYRQIDAILRNPEGNDTGKALEDLNKFTDECTKYYSLVKIKDLKTSLSSNTISFINSVSTYTNEIIKLARDKEITQSKNQDFTDKLDAVITKFLKINIDFPTELAKVRAENGNIDNVTAMASRSHDELNVINQEFTNIAVPESAVSCYNLFNKVLEGYESYVQGFIFASSNEKLLEAKPSNEKINELYSGVNSKFSEVNKNYSNFTKAYEQFKKAK